MSNTEQTYISGRCPTFLVGEILGRFERRGYKIVALKMTHPSKEHVENHYADLKDKPFFAGLTSFMSSGPVVAIVFEGKDVVKQGRAMLGATNPLASASGTIRGDFGIDMGRNICHGSDSVESAKKEIALWFPEGITQYRLPLMPTFTSKWEGCCTS
ncbi:hypothetical protein PSHT_02984 [Puccinia striiformis]|uniref:Nucleoside diphosphate kinase n=1 Tax=Puccinia striiformis TaxID=27350 RepID=A0A2S4WGT0_9BASI|nr:hypothetical protein PSHT_02984 [Puccinia striiformis]